MTLWPYPTTACGESRLIWKSQAASRTPNEVLDFWESAVMIGKEDELVPVVHPGTKLQEPVKGFGFAGNLDAHHVASQEIDPVLLRRTEQYVGRGERYMVRGKLGDQWRQETDIPEFTCFPPVARGDVADSIPVGDKFSQTDVNVLRPFVLVDPHAGFGHLLQSFQLVGVHPDDVIGVDQATGERIRGFPDSVVEECP